METLKIRNLMSSTKKKKKKENFEFLEEACPCRFLISENKYRKLISTENLYCAKIKKKKKIVSRWANIICQKIVTRTMQQFRLARSSCCSWKSLDSWLLPLTDIGSRIYDI